MSKKLVVLLIVSSLSTVAFGQTEMPIKKARRRSADTAANVVPPNSSATPPGCTYQFTSGGTGTKKYLQYCISANGNVVEFQSPAGSEQIGMSLIGLTNQPAEGYAICDLTLGGLGVSYMDYYAYAAQYGGLFQTSVLLNLTATTVKIARTTYDGIWTLTQTFTQNSADASFTVVMAVKNNSAVARSIWLTRVTDINANNNHLNIMDGTTDTVFGYDVSEHGHGLQISLAAANPYPHEGFATVPATILDPACFVGDHYFRLLDGGDGVANLLHVLTVPARGSKSVALKFRGM